MKPATTEMSNRSLPAAARHESTPTIAALFLQLAPSVHRYVAVRVRSDLSAADDIMQQLWLEVRGAELSQISDPEPWLRGVARNLVRRYWRSRGREATPRPMTDPKVAAEVAGLLDRQQIPPELLERSDVREQVLLALTLLSAVDQELVIRAHFRAQSQTAIAAELGLTPRAVEGRLYRARSALRELLAHMDPDEAS